jgi:hypothetical protein
LFEKFEVPKITSNRLCQRAKQIFQAVLQVALQAISKMPIRKCASKKGRMSGSARQEMNEQRITKIVSGKLEGTVFGRVTKMVGGCLLRAAIDCKDGRQEILVRIPGGFKRKGATPITTSAIVSVFVGKDFDPEADKLSVSDKFDLVAILGHKQASYLHKEGTIPDWMMTEVSTGASDMDAGYVFEAEETAADLFNSGGKKSLVTHEEADEGEEDEVDIDRI